MIRRPPRSTRKESSAASDVYKRQIRYRLAVGFSELRLRRTGSFMSDTTMDAIDQWHQMMATGRYDGLQELLSRDCVFWSPVVHTPQRGRDITLMYLTAAGKVFDTDFRYVREIRSADTAVLEFECSVDDIQVNGIDMIQVDNNQLSLIHI